MPNLKKVLEQFDSRLAYREEDKAALDISRSLAAGNLGTDKSYAKWAAVTNDPLVVANYVKTYVTTQVSKLSGAPFRPQKEDLFGLGLNARLNSIFTLTYTNVLNDGYDYLGIGMKGGVPIVKQIDARYIMHNGDEPTLRDATDVVVFEVVPLPVDEKLAKKVTRGNRWISSYVLYDPHSERVRVTHYHKEEGRVIMDFYDDEPYMIRRSRGYAPLPYMLSAWETGVGEGAGTGILAIGGELKNTFCIGTGSLFYPSSYIGDLADLRSVKALEETTERYGKLLEVTPQVIACDLHPRYNSVTTALDLARKIGGEQGGEPLPVVRVQHHYAHILSCMAENDFSERVIGVSMDGTGYGTDGTIWGGEILTADYHDFDRAASIRPFIQVGGDLSSRDGWRIAVSMLHSISREEDAPSALRDARALAGELGLCSDQEAAVLMKMADRRLNAVISTSAGRLFDAVSAICGICRHSTFEGEASMALEFAAERYGGTSGADGSSGTTETVCRDEDGRLILPTEQIVREITLGRLKGEDPDRLAWLFHRRLADQIIAACAQIRGENGVGTAALSGGCFQNRLLLDMVRRGLEEKGFKVLIHHLVPPNDGGIALGQAVAAVQAVHDKKVTPAGR